MTQPTQRPITSPANLVGNPMAHEMFLGNIKDSSGREWGVYVSIEKKGDGTKVPLGGVLTPEKAQACTLLFQKIIDNASPEQLSADTVSQAGFISRTKTLNPHTTSTHQAWKVFQDALLGTKSTSLQARMRENRVPQIVVLPDDSSNSSDFGENLSYRTSTVSTTSRRRHSRTTSPESILQQTGTNQYATVDMLSDSDSD